MPVKVSVLIPSATVPEPSAEKFTVRLAVKAA